MSTTTASSALEWRCGLRRLLSLLSTLALVATFVGWLMFLRPQALGGTAAFVIVSGTSMAPTLHAGDLAVMRHQDSYASGDVVAFEVPEGEPGAGAIVIHRIVGGDGHDGFETHGDNRLMPDLWRPREQDVLGHLELRVPAAGTAVVTLGSPVGAGVSAGLLVFLYVLTGGAGRSRSSDRHRDAAAQRS